MNASTATLNRTTDAPAWVATRTYPEAPDEGILDPVMWRWFDHGVANRRTVAVYADHGVGKTASTYAYAAARGLDLVYINMATASPEDKIGIFPTRNAFGQLELHQQVSRQLASTEPYVLVLDETRQAHPKVANQGMQMTNQWELGEQKLTGCVLVVTLDNEGAREGIRTSEDPAVADRKVTIRLRANDTGWRFALARKYADVDLKATFQVWDSLTPDLRHTLSPRTLDHMIQVGLLGFPLIWALPMPGGSRARLVSASASDKAQDRTREILDRIAVALSVPNPSRVPDAVSRVVAAATANHLSVLIQGPPGCGKTAAVREQVSAAGTEVVYFPMATTDPEQIFVPIPDMEKGYMETLLAARLTQANPYVIIWDEYNRPVSQVAFSKTMEIINQSTVDGIELPSLAAQVALCNPPTWLGRKMSVSKNNIAQADRFTISVEISPDDIDANGWLLAQYGADAEIVLEWWKNDITDEQREWVTKRTMERLIENHRSHLPLQNALIYLGESEFAPVPLIDLEARFNSRPQTRLAQIVTDVNKWVGLLMDAQETDATGNANVDTVVTALALAEPSQLDENFDTVVTLLGCLKPAMKGTFLDGSGNAERQKFWLKALVTLHKRTTSAAAAR